MQAGGAHIFPIPGPLAPAGNQDQVEKSRCAVGCIPMTVWLGAAQQPGIQGVRPPCGLTGQAWPGWGVGERGFGFEFLAAKVKKIITSTEVSPLLSSIPVLGGKTGPRTAPSPQLTSPETHPGSCSGQRAKSWVPTFL